MRPLGGARDAVPLHAGGERGPAAAGERGVGDLRDHPGRPELDGPAQRRVAAVGAVVVEALRVDQPDPAQQAQAGAVAAGLRGAHGGVGEGAVGRRVRRGPAAGPGPARPRQLGGHGLRRGRREADVRPAGALQQHRGRPLAQAEARAAHPAGVRAGALGAQLVREPGGDLLAAARAAGDVVADVHDVRRARLDGEHRVERGHPVHVGGRDRQHAGDVVERARADPADLVHHRVQRRQQQVPPSAGGVPGVGEVRVLADLVPGDPARARAARPRRPPARRATPPRPTGAGPRATPRPPARPPRSFSIRTAVALNSDVPDFGSHASLVRTLTSTSSEKCGVNDASPGRSDGSNQTGASTEPRREVTRTRSPSAMPSRAPSAASIRSDSRRRSGEAYPPVCTPEL